MTFDTSTILIIVAALAVLILAFLLVRPRMKRIEHTPREAEPYVASTERPYMRKPPNDWVTDEVAAATTDVAGEVLSVAAHHELDGAAAGPADRLDLLKGVGPKFAARLYELGVTRYEQLATLSEAELARLDERLGPFRGRLARDRVPEQADYLARGDVDGFEERFGNLG
jgi:predicted flap endonuclease-1-like 5' DNA nuclease